MTSVLMPGWEVEGVRGASEIADRVCSFSVSIMSGSSLQLQEEIHLNALRAECASSSIVLKVAERKRLGEKYISSSMVRQDMADGRTDEIALIVPEAVLEYL